MDLSIEGMFHSKDIWPICSKRRGSFNWEHFCKDLPWIHFIFFSWKELHFKQREEGNLLLYGYHQWDEDEKLQEIIFLLVFALSWCYQPSVWVPCSHSPIFQVTATPPKAGQWHRGLPVATDLPLPLDLTTFNLLTMYILPSSPCYCRSTRPFFTFAGQILCIPLLPHRSFDFIPWYPTVLTAVQFMHRHYMERHTNNENRSSVGRKCPKSPPWNGTTQLIPCILTVNNMEAHVGTCWCKWIGYSEQEGSWQTLSAAFPSEAFSRLIKQCFTDSFQTSYQGSCEKSASSKNFSKLPTDVIRSSKTARQFPCSLGFPVSTAQCCCMERLDSNFGRCRRVAKAPSACVLLYTQLLHWPGLSP